MSKGNLGAVRQAQLLLSEDAQTLNTAIFFLRRSSWSRGFLERVPRRAGF